MLDKGLRRGIAWVVLALLTGCGGGGGGGSSDGPAGNVAGLIIVQDEVARRDPAAVGTPPAEWQGDGAATAGKAALAHADWSLADEGRRGVTAGDGSFTIADLAPGRHVLELSRTLAGDLVATSLSIGVGDDGSSMVLGEIGWGMARATSTFTHDGHPVQEIFAPSTAHVTIEDGKIIELGDGVRVWQDVDRDGNFDTCTVVREAATCVVAQLGTILTTLPPSLRLGQRASAQAVLTLDDGSALDVTALVAWQSSDTTVASIDAFGHILALALGSSEIQARLGDLGSNLTTLGVDERAALLRLQVQNASCYYPYGVEDGQPVRPMPSGPPDDVGGVWAPTCRQVVEIGGTLSFIAVGEFADGAFEDVTGLATWLVTPAEIGEVTNGLFTGRTAGSGQLTASLDDVVSEPSEIRVVTEATLLSISIYAADGGDGAPFVGDVRPPAPDAGDTLPCTGCGGLALTLLLGDEVPLRANGEYDTGTWRDLTLDVAWSSSARGIATVGPDGKLATHETGETLVSATLGAVQSAPAEIRVVDDATLQNLWIYQSGERVVARGDQRFFTATGTYDLGFSRDVTAEADWHSSDPRVARFDRPGVLTGIGTGDVEVWAEADGVASDRVRLEVFEESALDYCDPANVNRGTWTDGFNRVLLESDCATYSQPDVAALRFTVTEKTSPGGIFDPCLDLYVFQGDTHVRTIREEGCGEPFLPSNSGGLDDEVLKYQLRAFWDLKDDRGQPVPPGTYQIHGRFYLYYDPVVSLTVTIE